MRNAICIFEHDTGVPTRRHNEMILYSKGANGNGTAWVGGLQGHTLVLRSVATVGNYDYIIGARAPRLSPSGLSPGTPTAAERCCALLSHFLARSAAAASQL